MFVSLYFLNDSLLFWDGKKHGCLATSRLAAGQAPGFLPPVTIVGRTCWGQGRKDMDEVYSCSCSSHLAEQRKWSFRHSPTLRTACSSKILLAWSMVEVFVPPTGEPGRV